MNNLWVGMVNLVSSALMELFKIFSRNHYREKIVRLENEVERLKTIIMYLLKR